MKKVLLFSLISFAFFSCVTIKPGEVGLKQKLANFGVYHLYLRKKELPI